jgi:FtsH-binding integral membrane protein
MDAFNRNQNMPYSMERGIDLSSIMRQVYIWMFLGMLLTTVVAFVTVSTSLINLASNPIILLVAIVAEFGVVLGISAGFKRLSSGAATALFFVYAALNGFTLSIVLLAFSVSTVFLAFASTAALFGAMTIIGYTTRVDLSKMGTYLMMALIGLIIAMVINLFVNSGPLDMIVSIVGVLIFTALTAYDTQTINRMASQMSMEGDAGMKFGVFGALKLYLDFINMFLFMLQLFGGRRR